MVKILLSHHFDGGCFMKFKRLCTVYSILAFLPGTFCVLIPAQLLASYDMSLSAMGLVIYQFWGVGLIGLGMLTWFIRNIEEAALQRKSALVLFITNGLSCVMAVRGQFAGANTFGWSTVVMYLLLSLSFGVFMCIKPKN